MEIGSSTTEIARNKDTFLCVQQEILNSESCGLGYCLDDDTKCYDLSINNQFCIHNI
jgi:hypothetical protein